MRAQSLADYLKVNVTAVGIRYIVYVHGGVSVVDGVLYGLSPLHRYR